MITRTITQWRACDRFEASGALTMRGQLSAPDWLSLEGQRQQFARPEAQGGERRISKARCDGRPYVWFGGLPVGRTRWSHVSRLAPGGLRCHLDRMYPIRQVGQDDPRRQWAHLGAAATGWVSGLAGAIHAVIVGDWRPASGGGLPGERVR